MTKSLRNSPVLLVAIVVGIIMGAAELIGGGKAWSAAVTAIVPIGYGVLVTVLARRSDSASVLAGRPVDERWEHIGAEASTWAFGASAIVVLAALVVVMARNGDFLPYAFIGAAMAVAYLAALILVRLHH